MDRVKEEEEILNIQLLQSAFCSQDSTQSHFKPFDLARTKLRSSSKCKIGYIHTTFYSPFYWDEYETMKLCHFSFNVQAYTCSCI